AAAAVNNFAVACVNCCWIPMTISNYSLGWFSRLGGPGLLTTSRTDDFELYRPARRAGLALLTTTPEGVTTMTLLYCRRWVKPAGKPTKPTILKPQIKT